LHLQNKFPNKNFDFPLGVPINKVSNADKAFQVIVAEFPNAFHAFPGGCCRYRSLFAYCSR
jgi:hypothetical protein